MGADDDLAPQVHYVHLVWSFLFPSLGGLLYGYDIGAMAMVLADLQSEKFSGTRWHGVLASSAALEGVVVAMVTLGAVVGSSACFQLEKELGRKNELLLASACYAVGSVLEYVAGGPTYGATTALVILCGARVIYGVGVGFAMHGAPSYIAETAPPHLRGTLVSAKEAMIVVGMLLGYSIGACFLRTEGAWRYTFLAALPVAVLMMGGLLVIPRSPRWLALQERHEEARLAMEYVTPTVSEKTLEELVAAAAPLHKPGEAAAGLFDDGASRLAMLAGLGLVILQQLTGQPSVLYYVAELFADVGLGTGATIGLAAWKLVCTSLSVVAVDRFGRRKLLFNGITIMAIALLVLALITLFGVAQSLTYDVAILGAMFLYIGGYQVGFGPISWTVISEVFPLQQRGQALAVATLTNFSLNALVSFAAAPMLDASLPLTFAIFFLLCVYSIYFVYYHVPETKGLTLERITQMLANRAAKLDAPHKSVSSSDTDRLLV